ncbi:DUF1566 domain-containing protein [Rhodocyclaceae bacterium SMB388]
MRVVSEPGGATLLINGQHYGMTPEQADQVFSIRLPAGEYALEATRALDGFSELYAAARVAHVEDRRTPVVRLNLARRLTEVGREREAEEASRLATREQMQLARYVANDDGTVLDVEAGLMWMRCSLGQTWTGVTCAGEAKRLNWDQALEAHEGVTFAGHDDWRLPTQPELYALTFCSSGMRTEPDREGLGGGCAGDYRRPTILESLFPNTPESNFWTSRPHDRFKFSAWGVAFHSGHTGTGGRTDYIHVRLVRDAK